MFKLSNSLLVVTVKHLIQNRNKRQINVSTPNLARATEMPLTMAQHNQPNTDVILKVKSNENIISYVYRATLCVARS